MPSSAAENFFASSAFKYFSFLEIFFFFPEKYIFFPFLYGAVLTEAAAALGGEQGGQG